MCVLSRRVVAWISFGSSVSASSVPNDCRVCAVFFTSSAKPSIAWNKESIMRWGEARKFHIYCVTVSFFLQIWVCSSSSFDKTCFADWIFVAVVHRTWLVHFTKQNTFIEDFILFLLISYCLHVLISYFIFIFLEIFVTTVTVRCYSAHADFSVLGSVYCTVYAQCGGRAISHGSTPVCPQAPASAACGRCRSAAPL